ncbi:MAG TPA: Na+/H+ antiporter NhaC family protein [Planctomycetota bacterium]|nr:Na+/H+ antiporter NhaC family protein [Planctomycetota bacterium]
MRPLAWLAVLGLCLAWLALPATDPAALAVQRIPALLGATIEGSDRTLVDPWLEQAAAPGGGSLVLGGVRLAIPGAGSDDLTIHARARRAVVASLRQHAARRGLALELRGEKIAVEGGPSVLFTLHDGRLSARVDGPKALSAGASIPAPASDRRALLPALLASALVLLWRRPLVALFAGLALGAVLVVAIGLSPVPKSWDGIPVNFVRMLFGELGDSGAWKPIVTLLCLLATWAITARNGGLGGFTAWLGERARTARRAQIVTWLCASVAFFEAPGKNVVLGWALRTSAVRARVSSEKFAWLLDSTGTAVLGLCLLSPWTGFVFRLAESTSGFGGSAGELWLATLPWRGLCFLTLALGLVVAVSGRDFGTLLAAERRAREGQGAHARAARRVFAAPEPDPRTKLQAWRAIAPFSVYALALATQGLRDGGALAGKLDFTRADGWLALARAMDQPDTAMIAALAALLVALALSSAAGAERGVPAALLRGLRAALRPCLLLLGAWALGFVSTRLGAGEVLAANLGERIAPQTLPALAFLAGVGGAFTFGSAAASLPLFLPLVLGLATALGPDFASGPAALTAISLAALLEGTLAGALLSPLSASSLSASIGAGADHTDHVRTQSPYVLLTTTGVLLGFLAAGLYGVGPWSALALAALVQWGVFAWLSRSSQRQSA